MTTAPLLGSGGSFPTPDEDFAKEEIPTGVAPWPSRIAATIVDLGIIVLPLGIGWSIVDSLRDDNGGGEADRFVFGAIALAVQKRYPRGLADGEEAREQSGGYK